MKIPILITEFWNPLNLGAKASISLVSLLSCPGPPVGTGREVSALVKEPERLRNDLIYQHPRPVETTVIHCTENRTLKNFNLARGCLRPRTYMFSEY